MFIKYLTFATLSFVVVSPSPETMYVNKSSIKLVDVGPWNCSTVCPSQTCCIIEESLDDITIGCCGEINAVCCSCGMACCPGGFTCGLGHLCVPAERSLGTSLSRREKITFHLYLLISVFVNLDSLKY